MATRPINRGLTLCVAGLLVLAGRLPAPGQEPEWRRLLKASEAEQVSYIKAVLDRGSDLNGLTMLVLNKSELTLPLIRAKIEEVIRSATPADCFSDKSVDPKFFVALAAATIAYAGNEHAIREAGKLIQLDEQRFGGLVGRTLIHVVSRSERNPFDVAYRGLDIGDTAVNDRIIAWAEEHFSQWEDKSGWIKRSLAEAMTKRYKGVPTEAQWSRDPLVSRLRIAKDEGFRKEVLRRAAEVPYDRQISR